MRGAAPEPHTGWTFLTNHARVLAAIAEDPNTRIRDIAAHCRLTERAVQKIISDLEQDGYLSHTRQGRTNTYRIEQGVPLRHPAEAEAGVTVAELLSVLARHDAQRGTHESDDAPAPAGRRDALASARGTG
ncbi:winged helix-turn-helix domain-containing protein [Streptomyces sp. TG1A-8]|uniref:helix-turn-helix transcriptional regulator n=1 Tax=Streptomyces sp. TG1A-8 TaxID=3051385 RepID=UPI00265C1A82|nr:winged helix-turn-helix domain-containing protein [Streptomyces sp. TG1A-8]MDO0924724.1 winged helix-turn-helix domain-containing protein [Streptomyces sp. TG1A-8]